MLRLALVSALAALGACSNPDAAPTSAGAAVAESVAVTTLAQADVTPAAPPVSNAIPDAAPEAPRDTTDAQARTVQTFERIVADADSQRVAERPFGEVVQWVGEQLVGRPYVAGMLDAGPTETLVADLTAFDCVLYVENVIAIARVLALGTPTYDAYTAELRSLRYRDDDVQYCARLHYFSDWIRDNEARGAVENVTAAVGGEPFDKQITFMGEHRDAYPQLADDATYQCVLDMESELAAVDLFYIPQNRIAQAYDQLRPGDVIATATSIGGLDVTHTGFVHKGDSHTGFMHASLSSNRVKVSDDLQTYVQGIRSQVGVVVARPRDPRG